MIPKESARSQLEKQSNNRSKLRRALTLWFGVVFLYSQSAGAAQIDGTVRSTTAKYATVVSTSASMPIPGDKVLIYFKVPGTDVEVSVATGHVYEITGANIMVQIDKAMGTVAKDQLVRIDSANPKTKFDVNVASSSASPLPTDKTTSGSISSTSPAKSSPSIPSAPPLGTWKSSPPAATPSAAGNSQTTDLVDAEKKIVGTWQGQRHRKQYLADGTMFTDPHLVPNPPVAHWSINGGYLIEHYPNVPDLRSRIVSITDQELTITDAAAHIFHLKRIPDDQAAREKANW